MRTIVISKTGSLLYSELGGNPRGEIDSLPIIEEVADRGDVRVVYFGKVNGELRPDVEVINPVTREWDELTSADTLRDDLDQVVSRLKGHDVAAVINPTGMPATWSWTDLSTTGSVMAFSVRYSLPCLWVCHALGVPRLCIITDPKCYPREGEMNTWPECRPAALLSQERREWSRVIAGKRYECLAVPSGAEFWNTRGVMPRSSPTRDYVVTTAANLHATAGALPHHQEREGTWDQLLRPFARDHPGRVKVCGKGWDTTSLYRDHPEAFAGVVPKLSDVFDLLGSGECGPCLPQREGFNTTKPRQHALMDNAPLLYSVHPFYYDVDERILSKDHPARIRPCETLDVVIQRVDARGTVEEILEKTEPDHSLLHEMIDRVVAGQTLPWEMFGGYK